MDFSTIEYDGRRFRLADQGQGDTVVLLHGFPDGPESWDETATALAAAGHRVVVPYLRGYHVDTIDPERGYAAAEITGDVIDLLDALDVERAVVVGHDWGASCTWGAAGRAPERIRAIVPVGIPHPATLRPSPRLAWAVRHFWNFKAPLSDRRTARRDLAYIDTLYRRWSPAWTGARRDDTVARAKQILSDPMVLHEALNWYRALSFKPDPANDFRFPGPGLLVAGGSDFGGDLDPYRRSLERFDDSAELLVIDGAGHWPHREGQKQFDEALLAFVASVP